jgi:hemoglobin
MNDESSLYDRLGGHDGILKLLKSFYADVRQHAVLGPIFNSHIQNWPEHLEKIASFWSLQTGGESNYGGGFAGAHLKLGLEPEHFGHWLGLWELNSERQLPPREAEEMKGLAQRLGGRLLTVVQSYK